MSETGVSLVCHICGHTNETGAQYCAGCRAQLSYAPGPPLVARWRARARLRRMLLRAAAASLALLVVAWGAIENIGVARFLPDPASGLTSELQVGDWPTEGGSPLRANAAAPERPHAPLTGAKSPGQADLGAPPGGGRDRSDGGQSCTRVRRTVACSRVQRPRTARRCGANDVGSPVSATPSSSRRHLVYVGNARRAGDRAPP